MKQIHYAVRIIITIVNDDNIVHIQSSTRNKKKWCIKTNKEKLVNSNQILKQRRTHSKHKI